MPWQLVRPGPDGSRFAQTLGTPYPISDKRIRKALADS
ncbi:DUF3418 domain-containing protein [Kribbella sp. NPDC004875]